MFSFKEKINNITSYYINNTTTATVDKSYSILINNKIIKESVFDDIIIDGNNIYFNKDGSFWIYNLNNDLIEKIDNKELINSISRNDSLLMLIDCNEKLYLFNKTIKELKELQIEDYNWGNIFIYDVNTVFINDKKFISAFFNIDKFNNWQTDISKIGKYIPFLEEEERDGEVDQFVGVWSNELIVLLKGGKFIGIEVETGNINWEQNRVQNNKTSHTIDFNFGEPYHPFLNEEKGMIYILQGEAFIELDLKTKIATYTWSSLELTSENYVFIRQSRLFDNKILFSAFRKGNIGNDDTIGIFDIEKKEIIWQYKFDFEKDNFIPNSQNSIQMNDNNVYVLDWKGTLHIFEKE